MCGGAQPRAFRDYICRGGPSFSCGEASWQKKIENLSLELFLARNRVVALFYRKLKVTDCVCTEAVCFSNPTAAVSNGVLTHFFFRSCGNSAARLLWVKRQQLANTKAETDKVFKFDSNVGVRNLASSALQ